MTFGFNWATIKDVKDKVLVDILVGYDRELMFFRAFHQNNYNRWIHVFCIPLEWLGWLLLLAPFRLHWILTVSIISYYLVLESPMKFQAISCHIMLMSIAESLSKYYSWFSLYLWSGCIQLIAWSLQVGIGHTLLENNKPGFMTDLTLNAIVLSILLAFDVFD